MTVNHAAVAALPTSGDTNKGALRNLLVARMAYVLADVEDSRDLVAVDPSTGATIIDLVLFGRYFHLDATDTTTAHDGTSCLVSSDGLRYKLAAGTDVFAYSVLDNTLSAPPGSPTRGDAYLVAAGASGAWAGKSNQITVYTRRGWEFINFGIGRFIYVRSIDTYYHKNAGGSWVVGLGNQTFAANSVPLSAAINFGRRMIVENQTTTVPPASPSVGTAYIIAPSATGAWAGADGKLAICEIAGTFTLYTPGPGWLAFDKAQGVEFRFDGTSWVSTSNPVKRINSATDPVYNVTSADNGLTLSFYGGAFAVVLFPSATALPVGFKCTIHNEETGSVGKGVGGTNVGSFTLYPTQSYDVERIATTVTLMGGLRPWMRNGVQLYVHATNGSDDPLVADGLADSARAFKTEAAAWQALNKNFLHCGGQSTVTLTGDFPAHHEFHGQPPGCQAFYWVGAAPGAFTKTYTSGGSCWTIGDGCCMLFGNVTFFGGGANVKAIQQHQKSIVDQLGGVVFDNFGSGTGAHYSSDGSGWTYNQNASYTIANGGNAGSHIAALGSGVVNVVGGITVSINGPTSAVFGSFYNASGPVLINLGGAITYGTTGSGTKQWTVAPGAYLSRNGNTIPGNLPGTPAAGSAPGAGSGWVS
ncbi:DUF2793 domain-containing protein [Bradyrhizobium sp. HKCCYLR20261]|uniref:DUF2793 domain-containing protein n=1 Tax=Bradyrhizobium sp. HKCCYLR20261 TaxID=3420760 RepID=UPI003EC03E68